MNSKLGLGVEASSVDVEDDDVVEWEEVSTDMVAKGKRKRKLNSQVCGFFEMLPMGVGKKPRCKCKKCGAIYLVDGKYGISNLKRHMQTCVIRDIRDLFDNKKFRELVTMAIIRHDLPFQFVEYAGVREIFLYLREDLKLISRNNVKADVLKMHNREKVEVKTMLELAPGRISLTSNLWTSMATNGYVCITAHFLDKDWILQKKVLNFCLIPTSHNDGVFLADKIFDLLDEWGIIDRLFTITLDNAPVNDSFIEMMKDTLNRRKELLSNGQFFHLQCCAHVLNLMVEEGLKEIDDLVQKIQESIKYVKGSQEGKQQFLKWATFMSLDSKKGLRQDVPTRWNSTFLMLKSAIYYRRVFCSLESADSNYVHCPSKDEWDKVEKILKFLGVFYEATCIFSRSKYPTANLYFPSMFIAQLTLKKNMESGDYYMQRMASQMNIKFEKYWSEFGLILAIAVVFDPRYKIQFVEFCYKKLYGSNSIEFLHFRENLFSLFDEYMSIPITPSTSSPGKVGSGGVSESSDSSFSTKIRDMMKEFDSFERECGSFPKKTQLEAYLEEPRCDQKTELDVLAIWKSYEFCYPNLAAMARDILSIPITTVPLESAFNVSEKILDQYRSALEPDTMEALVCTKDWLFGERDVAQVPLDELTQDIMIMDINKEDTS